MYCNNYYYTKQQLFLLITILLIGLQYRYNPDDQAIYNNNNILLLLHVIEVDAFHIHPKQQQQQQQRINTLQNKIRSKNIQFFQSKVSQKSSLSSFDSIEVRNAVSSFDQQQQHEQQEQAVSSSSNPIKKIKQQRIAIIGSGAVGSYYGGRLWEIGHDVHFLLRNHHYTTAKRYGMNITSVDGNIYIPNNQINAYPSTFDMITTTNTNTTSSVDTNTPPTTTTTTTTTTSIPPLIYDWVIVALKSSSLDAIPDLILPLLHSNHTRVLCIMNGMIENDLLQLMKQKNNQTNENDDKNDDENEPLQCCHTWYGGMALICCNRIQSCYIDHTYFGLLTVGVASTKECSIDHHTINEMKFRELFQYTKIDVAYDTSLLRGRWNKMIWNLPFNGISVAMGGITVDQIVNDIGLRQLAYHIMDETIHVANVDLQMKYGCNNYIPLGNEERTKMMQLSDDMGMYKPSTMLDYIHRRSMEVLYLFRTPLNRAKQLNISTPYLETIVLQIEAYQRMYNLY
jgi:2-dehydropantoate 2-reductase